MASKALGQETIRNFVVIFPVSFHLTESLKLLAGPGFESTPKRDKFAFRLGAGYELGLPGRWSLGPEFYVDLIETGASTWVLGLVLGFEL